MMQERNVELSPFQVEFLRRKDEPLVILQTGVGAGKSRALAHWCVYTARKGYRILAVAQNYSALMEVLFREIEIVCAQIGITCDKTGKKLHIGNGWIYGATGENPKGILGYTDFNAAVFDEAAYLKRNVYDFVCDRLRGENVDVPLYRFTSSPSSEPASVWFRELCEQNQDKVIRATSLDNAFTSKQYKKDLIKRYGLGTNLFRQQVLGEFLDTDLEDTLFTHELLKNVKSRIASDVMRDELAVIGLDCARYGQDYSVAVLRIGRRVVKVLRARETDTGQLVAMVRKLKGIAEQNWNIKIDSVCVDAAYGSGAIDMLKSLGYTVYEVSFAGLPKRKEYYNVRAEMYFTAKDWLKEGGTFEDEELYADLSAQRYMLDDGGKFRLIPKEMIKKAIERSPDTSDAFALTFYHAAIRNDYNKKQVLDSPAMLNMMKKLRMKKSTHKFAFK